MSIYFVKWEQMYRDQTVGWCHHQRTALRFTSRLAAHKHAAEAASLGRTVRVVRLVRKKMTIEPAGSVFLHIYTADPAAVIRRAEVEGPIAVLNAQGEPMAIVSFAEGWRKP